MVDKFSGMNSSLESPGREMFLIAPHATNPVDPLPRAIRADSAGTVTLRAVDSGADVTVTMQAGEVLPVRAQYIRVTGTTVTTIHGIS